MIRYSGTEALARVMIEAESGDEIQHDDGDLPPTGLDLVVGVGRVGGDRPVPAASSCRSP